MNNSSIPKDIMPTLIIGLGGTGFQVIKRLKKLFRKRYGESKLPVRYLIIDTDLKSFLDDDIENNEKCQLRFNEGIKATLDWTYNNSNFDWLPRNPVITPDFFISTDQGAGLMRPIGRLYLCKNAKLVYDTLMSAKNDLVDLYKILTDVGEGYLESIDRQKVYVVGSLAGGTGCGTFLDVSVMLSKVFNRDNTNIIGMFTMESCYDYKLSSDLDAQNRSKANCYAALKELEFYMSCIENSNDERYVFKYNNLGDIKLEKKLLDICYLIENKNEMGGVLTNIDDIYDLCSLQLFQEVGTKLGSQLRADYTNFICKDKDPNLNRDRHFSTFSSSSMEVPIGSLKKYCECKLMEDILKKLSGKDNTMELNSAIKELTEKIDDNIEKESILKDFRSNYKVSSKKLEDVKKKIHGLSSVERIVNDKLSEWDNKKVKCKGSIEDIIKSYTNEGILRYGLDNLSKILKGVKEEFRLEYEEYTVKEEIDISEIKKDIEDINDRKILKGKKDISNDICNDCNKFIDLKYDKLCNSILKQRNIMVNEFIDEIVDKISIIKVKINKFVQFIKNNIDKINYQAEKKYGGNIISREMINKEFYYDFYSENYGDKLDENINSILEGVNIIDVLKDDNKELFNICSKEVAEIESKVNIIDILSKNAKNQGVKLQEYVKNEIEITTKLAKPFWSAVKNPEVSWTECYYIGSVKDDNITNGFTIKPHEPIDNWIRSQMGERARQARFVETTNPYSIDVIHITMGACAGYLPDVKNYKDYYLNLLSSQVYPLHLNQSYIGFTELDTEGEELLELYTSCHAYGVIINMHNKYILNIKFDGDQYKYIYDANNCLNIEEKLSRRKEVPLNVASIEEMLILGDKEKDVIDRLSEDKVLIGFLKDLFKYIYARFSEEELITHKRRYIEYELEDKNNLNGISKKRDFIALEKLKSELLDKQW